MKTEQFPKHNSCYFCHLVSSSYFHCWEDSETPHRDAFRKWSYLSCWRAYFTQKCWKILTELKPEHITTRNICNFVPSVVQCLVKAKLTNTGHAPRANCCLSAQIFITIFLMWLQAAQHIMTLVLNSYSGMSSQFFSQNTIPSLKNMLYVFLISYSSHIHSGVCYLVFFLSYLCIFRFSF